MNTDSYARKVLKAQALIDGITSPARSRKPEKREPASRSGIFPSLTKQLLSSLDSKKKSFRFSFPSIVPTPRGRTVDIEEKISSEDGPLSAAYNEVLSLQNFSNGKASIFKLRGASSRF